MNVFVLITVWALLTGWWVATVFQSTIWASICGVLLLVYIVWGVYNLFYKKD